MSTPRGRAALGSAVAVLAAAFAALILSAGPAAASNAYPPTVPCQLSGATLHPSPGSTFPVVGSGFPAGGVVQISANGNKQTVHADTTGSFRTSVQIPASFSGPLTITALNQGCSTTPTVTVSPAPTPAPAAVNAEASGGGLAFTGFAAISATIIGCAVLVGGVILTLLGKRRKTS